MKKSILLFLLFISCTLGARGTHLLGGYYSYKVVSAQSLLVTFTLIRDPKNGQAEFEYSIDVPMYRKSDDSLTAIYKVNLHDQRLDLIKSPNGGKKVYIDVGVYKFHIPLSALTQASFITYTRCCRGATVLNTGENTGFTYLCELPVISSASDYTELPEFNSIRPSVLNVQKIYTDTLDIKDSEGDSLSFKIVTPLAGGSIDTPIVTPASKYIAKKIKWSYGYSDVKMLGDSSYVDIDSQNILRCYCYKQGMYIVGLEISEYRNKKRIGLMHTEMILYCGQDSILEEPDTTDITDTTDTNTVSVLRKMKRVEQLSVYPNPAKTHFYVNTGEAGVLRWELMLADGRTLRRSLAAPAHNETLILNVEDLPVGLYFIKVQLADRTVMLRALKE